MSEMTLDEARELVRERAEAYEVAKMRSERLGMADIRAGLGAEYHVATAERDRAWSLLLEAQGIFVRAERTAPEPAASGENISKIPEAESEAKTLGEYFLDYDRERENNGF